MSMACAEADKARIAELEADLAAARNEQAKAQMHAKGMGECMKLLTAQVKQLQAQLEAIGAGGVSALMPARADRVEALEAVAQQALDALEDVRDDCSGFPHPEYQKQLAAVGALRRVLADGALTNEGTMPVALTDKGDKPALTAPVTDGEVVRAFEAWASHPDRGGKLPIEKHKNGAYTDSRTYSAWYGWKSCAAIACAPPAERRPLTARDAEIEASRIIADAATTYVGETPVSFEGVAREVLRVAPNGFILAPVVAPKAIICAIENEIDSQLAASGMESVLMHRQDGACVWDVAIEVARKIKGEKP